MTVSSMTGFARAEGAMGGWSWSVEARSVNGRNLELRFKGPGGFESLERLTREASQARFHRGQLNVTVQARRAEELRRTRINVKVLEDYIAVAESYRSASHLAPPSLDGLMALPGVIVMSESDESEGERAPIEAAISATVMETLDLLKVSRRAEGRAIDRLLSGFLNQIDGLVEAARSEAAQQIVLIKTRFERRLEDLIGEKAEPARILQEAAVMAVKADVREEIDRLTGHVQAARTLLVDEAAAGRRLDFLTQEFMREANTLCSKSGSSSLTTVGLDIKAAVDQFREQVQNVE